MIHRPNANSPLKHGSPPNPDTMGHPMSVQLPTSCNHTEFTERHVKIGLDYVGDATNFLAPKPAPDVNAYFGSPATPPACCPGE